MTGFEGTPLYRCLMPLIRRIAVAAALAVGAGALGLGVAVPADAGSREVYPVPANGIFTVRGHGWGHGHGMSQYGAYGAAKVKGMTYQQILAFYYPHTALVGQPLATTVKVLLHGTTSGRLVVTPHGAAKLIASTSADGVPDCDLPDSLDDGTGGGGKTAVAQWRARVVSTPEGTRVRLQASADGDTWTTHPKVDGCDPAWSKPLDGSITFDGGKVTNLVRSTGVAAYRGTLRAAFNGTRIFVVNVVRLDDYLLSVVPSEMPASWSPAALQAQAVAARTYASYEIAHPKNKPYYDVFDDTRDQVYGGKAHEAGSTTAAVKATQDPKTQTSAVLHDAKGSPAFTQFSSSDGGWTVDGGQAYLPAQRDPYDGLVPSSVHTWSATVSAASIEHAYGSQIGDLRAVVVTDRDGNGQWGGRITEIQVVGDDGRLTLSGSTFRYAFGLRSEWFRVVLPPARPTQVTATVSSGVATVGWQPPPARSGVAPVTGYRVELRPGGLSARVDRDARTATIAGLEPSTDYVASVVALSKSGPGRSALVTTKVHRIAGTDRVTTAVAASRVTFGAGKAKAVVLVRRSGAVSNAFTAAPLAGATHAPVLLTARKSVPPPTQAEIQRVLPPGGIVYLLGPPTVIDEQVRMSLRALGYHAVRKDGATPAAVARGVARTVGRMHAVTRAFEVDADDASAAWVAGAAAAARHGVVLLTDGGSLPPETATWLAHHKDVKRFAVGGAAASADPSATAFTGADAGEVAVAVAQRFFTKARRAAVVSPGQLAAGIASAGKLAVSRGPLLYASGAALSQSTASYLSSVRTSVRRVDLVGSQLPYDDVESGVQKALLGR